MEEAVFDQSCKAGLSHALKRVHCPFRGPGKPHRGHGWQLSALSIFQLLPSLLLCETQNLGMKSDIGTRTWEGEQVFFLAKKEKEVSL